MNYAPRGIACVTGGNATVININTKESIPGLFYLPTFLSKSEQKKLLKFLKDEEWKNLGGPGSQKVIHYGYNYPYSRELKLTPATSIPPLFKDLIISKFKNVPILANYTPDQAIVNRYLSGEGIGKHTDHKKLFGEKIVCITIGSGADMVFRNYSGKSETIKTEPGSCYIMSGDARWKWTHEMPRKHLEEPRYSITFRNVVKEYVKLDRLTIWTDGACTNNGYANARAGYGVYFEGKGWDISKRLKGKQTNNRAELYAVYAALKRIYWRDTQKKELHFRIDNKIALDTLLSDRKSGANWDIIEKIYKVRAILVRRGYIITGEWVKGHSKVGGNERADELATYGAQKNKRN